MRSDGLTREVRPLGASRPLSSLAFAWEARTQWVVVGCGPPQSAATQTMDLDAGTAVPDPAGPIDGSIPAHQPLAPASSHDAGSTSISRRETLLRRYKTT